MRKPERYRPYTLGIMYFIDLLFCEILCPERENYLKKKLCFLFCFCTQKEGGGSIWDPRNPPTF